MTAAAPGWYPDPSGAPGQRYFDGADWTEARQAAPLRPVLPDAERSALLDRAVAEAVARGGRIESRTAFQAVIVNGKQVNNVLHVLLFLFTCGLWLFVWLFLLVSGGEKRQVLTIDPYGDWITGR